MLKKYDAHYMTIVTLTATLSYVLSDGYFYIIGETTTGKKIQSRPFISKEYGWGEFAHLVRMYTIREKQEGIYEKQCLQFHT